MLYVQSEALRTSSRDVGLGRSMNQWLAWAFRSAENRSIRLKIRPRESADAASPLTARERNRWNRPHDDLRPSYIHRFGRQSRALEDSPGQGTLFPQVAKLSEQFFQQLTDHPVPLEEAAVRAISNNSMALDLYAWLAYRLHVLEGTTPVSWSALKGQFGAGFDSMRHFRPSFLDNLRLAMAVYRSAKVDVTERGVDLFPSRPPVAPRQGAAGKVPTLQQSAPMPVESSVIVGL